MTGNAERALAQALERAIAEHTGSAAHVDQVERLSGGASQDIIAFTAAVDGQTRELVLRRDSSGSEAEFGLSEYRILSLAYAAGTPTPEPLFYVGGDPDLGSGYVMSRVRGETLAPRILRDPRYESARAALLAQIGRALASIHAISPDDVPFLEPDPDPLARWRDVLDRIDGMYPVLELSYEWLRSNLPRTRKRVLVHGDFRLGNLVVDDDGLRAVLDWELAHVGDPMEDLGWLCVRAWRFGRPDLPAAGLGAREDLADAYEQASGVAVDPFALRYWEIYGNFKWAVICLLQAETHLSGARRSVELAAIGRRVAEPEWEILSMLESQPVQ